MVWMRTANDSTLKTTQGTGQETSWWVTAGAYRGGKPPPWGNPPPWGEPPMYARGGATATVSHTNKSVAAASVARSLCGQCCLC
jgi:hypothetical protein